jgi:hypothetical protein
MNTQAGFILKILLLSTVISIVIKYGGQLIPLKATTNLALITVFLPSLIIALILGWQYRKY